MNLASRRREPTTPDFWMHAQKAVDLWDASRKVGALPSPLLEAS